MIALPRYNRPTARQPIVFRHPVAWGCQQVFKTPLSCRCTSDIPQKGLNSGGCLDAASVSGRDERAVAREIQHSNSWHSTVNIQLVDIGYSTSNLLTFNIWHSICWHSTFDIQVVDTIRIRHSSCWHLQHSTLKLLTLIVWHSSCWHLQNSTLKLLTLIVWHSSCWQSTFYSIYLHVNNIYLRVDII